VFAPRQLRCVAAAFVASVTVGATAAPAVGAPPWRAFYVAPDGRDTAPGTADAPFATLDRAQAAVRSVNSSMAGDIVVYLRGGIYQISNPLVLDSRDSGVNGHVVRWRSYPGERAVISGGRSVSGWTPAGFVGGRAVFRAPTGGDVGRVLHVGGIRAMRARGTTLPGLEMTSSGYTTTAPEAATWPNHSDIEFVYDRKWRQLRGRVDRVEGQSIMMRQPWWNEAIKFGASHSCCRFTLATPTRVEGAFILLDDPGEWYLHRAEKMIYYIPRDGEDLSRTSVVLGVQPSLLELRGTLDAPVHDVVIEHVTFAHAGPGDPYRSDLLGHMQANFSRVIKPTGDLGGWGGKMSAAVTVRAATRATIATNSFEALGGAGLNVEYGSRDVTVERNRFLDISGNAIQLGDVTDHHPRDDRAVVERVQVLDNLVEDVAVEFEAGVGIWAGYVRETTIAYNEVGKVRYSGISLGWGWGKYDDPPTPARDNAILNNHVHDVLQTLEDGGGIYTLGAQPGLKIAANVIERSRKFGGALYLDEGTRYVTVSRNVVLESDGWGYVFKGRDNTIRENFWDTGPSRVSWAFFEGGVVENNVVLTSGTAPPEAICAGAGVRSDARESVFLTRPWTPACGTKSAAPEPPPPPARTPVTEPVNPAPAADPPPRPDQEVVPAPSSTGPSQHQSPTPSGSSPSGGSERPPLRGTSGDDVLRGTMASDFIYSGRGRDVIFARAGRDHISAGRGGDLVHAGRGADHIDAARRRDAGDYVYGGRGRDRVIAFDHSFDRISCGSGFDIVFADWRDAVGRDCERVIRR
jgi:hypothetical protein